MIGIVFLHNKHIILLFITFVQLFKSHHTVVEKYHF